jgi:pyruvate,orthophosphate dikinase
MQDFEFTIEENKLYMLQTRNGKRTGPAAVRVAVDMCEEGMIDKKEAVLRVAAAQLDQLLHPVFDVPSLKTLTLLATGIDASPGAAVGRAVFTAEEAVEMGKNGPVILVRKETTPDDIHGMDVAKGILTAVGGKSSHAAVVARGMGRPCIVGAGSISIERARETVHGERWRQNRRGERRRLDFDGRREREVYQGQAKTNAARSQVAATSRS